MQWKTGPKTKLVVGPETKLSINLPELSYHAARPVPPNRWPILDPYCFLFWFWTSGTREAGTGELAERTAMLQHGSLPCSPMPCGAVAELTCRRQTPRPSSSAPCAARTAHSMLQCWAAVVVAVPYLPYPYLQTQAASSLTVRLPHRHLSLPLIHHSHR